MLKPMLKPMLKIAIHFVLFTFLALPALAVEVGGQAPCMDLDQLKADGTRTNHSICDRNAGTQFLLLEFFQTGCGACMANLPSLSQLSQEAQATLTSRLVALDTVEQKVVDFVAKNQDLIKFEVPLDSKRVAAKAYGIQFTPTTFVVDKAGKVIYKHTDVWTQADYDHILKLVSGQ